MEDSSIKFTMLSRDSNTRLAGSAIRSICIAAGMNEEDASITELALVEAINNIIEHAYEDRPDGLVEFEFSHNSSEIIITLADSGRPAELRDISLPAFDPADIDSLPESGLGMHLIDMTMDNVERLRSGNRNILRMRKWKK
ncbi:MAG: ATP-binding protein [Bacteroidota bacterium]